MNNYDRKEILNLEKKVESKILNTILTFFVEKITSVMILHSH